MYGLHAKLQNAVVDEEHRTNGSQRFENVRHGKNHDACKYCVLEFSRRVSVIVLDNLSDVTTVYGFPVVDKTMDSAGVVNVVSVFFKCDVIMNFLVTRGANGSISCEKIGQGYNVNSFIPFSVWQKFVVA